ncbi:MAG: sugar kinase [Deltaproteobacteria bacterium]|nr:MAG: sugar kinase [Deltaproteobacteria bacterium]
MLAVVGTTPDQDFPLVAGKVTLHGDRIHIQGNDVSVNRGTHALLAAAIKTAEALGHSGTFGYLVGDIGLGDGSRLLYEYLTKHIREYDFHTIVFHYMQPDVDWHNRVLFAVEEMNRRPVLIADAGFMYAAKMSGQALAYDLFTPDVGELAFLADENAPHPFYTRGFILHEENSVPDLISRAYRHENASRFLLVKGRKDYLADQEGIRATVDNPAEKAMEAIGGTGDTLTGIVAALINAGGEIDESAVIAAKVNRLAGHYARPSPATQVTEIIHHIPRALADLLRGKKCIQN